MNVVRRGGGKTRCGGGGGDSRLDGVEIIGEMVGRQVKGREAGRWKHNDEGEEEGEKYTL